MKNNPVYSRFFIALALHGLSLIVFYIRDLNSPKEVAWIDKTEEKKRSLKGAKVVKKESSESDSDSESSEEILKKPVSKKLPEEKKQVEVPKP
jgi:hypothetical protein